MKIVCAVWDFIARHPAMLAMPLIIFLLVLTIQMHEFEKQVQAWDQEIRQQQEQIEELYDRQDPVEQTDMTDVYGCKSLYGTYDFPWNTMSQDWGSDQVTGFYYHEISEESYEEIADIQNCGKNTPSRWSKELIRKMSVKLFGIDGVEKY